MRSGFIARMSHMDLPRQQQAKTGCGGFRLHIARIWWLIGSLLLLSAASWAESSPKTIPKADLVVVNKSERKLLLIQGGRVYRNYRVALGKNPEGGKRQKGDNRTPEGVYFLDWKNGNSRFYKSIHISYPNEQDLGQAISAGVHPGGMIMIHGIPDNPAYPEWLFESIDWTDGCIAVNNQAMDEIWVSVDEGTPIRILP